MFKIEKDKYKQIKNILVKTIGSTLVVTMVSISIFPLFNTGKGLDNNQTRVIASTQKENNQIISGKETSETRPTINRLSSTSRGSLSRDEVYLLAKVIEGEAADEPYKGKVAVGAVILNRVKNDKFPKTLSGVIYQDVAFESVSNGQYNRVLSADSIKAAQEAMQGSDPTNGALYFWNPATAKSTWVWSRPVTGQIGKHVFAK